MIPSIKKAGSKRVFTSHLPEREKLYPTGLDTGEYKIAIPHTDPDMVEDRV